MLAPEELHRRAIDAMNRGRFPRARQLLERAREGVTTDDLRSRVEASLAFVLCETGQAESALDLATAALARDGIAEETRGLLHGQIGLMHMLRGEAAAALAHFDPAITLLEDPVVLGRAHLNRGGVYLQQGRPDDAVADFAEAERHFTRAGDDYMAAMAAHNLGYTQLLRGDLVEALRAMDAAYPRLAPEGPVVLATCEQDRAEVLVAAGLVTEGREALRAASRAYGSRRLHQRRGDAELALARTLVLADPAAALKAARTARSLYARVGSSAWEVRAEAVALGASVELGRAAPALVTRGDELSGQLVAQGLNAAAQLVRLHVARVLVRRGRYDEARERLARVRLGAGSPLAVRLLARTARTELAVAQGRVGAALRQVRAGISDLHAWQSTFGSLDLQTAVVGQGRRLAVLGLGLAVEHGSPEVLYEWSERGRMLASRIHPIRPHADAETAADLAELRRLAAGSDGVQVPSPRRDAELRRRVRERAWRSRGSGEVSEPAPLEDVRRALGADAALVAWVVTGDRVTGLVVTDDGTTTHPLGSVEPVRALLGGLLPDLDMAAADDLPPTLATAVRAGLVDRLDELGAVLVAPLLDRIGDRRVVATPSGALAGTPWSLLPGLVGRPVTVAPSATTWLARVGEPLALHRAGLVAGPRVVRAEAEVRAAAAGWSGARVLVGPDATADAVAGVAVGVDVLHVAAHGRHAADSPLFSGLELAGGPWFGYDIDLLPVVPSVVVLSACEVGRSSVRFGEELIGMTAAWLHAGARCVVASPSAVADTAAHDVLTAMHAGLASGLDPAAALAAAVPPPSPDAPPAPFVCFGAGW